MAKQRTNVSKSRKVTKAVPKAAKPATKAAKVAKPATKAAKVAKPATKAAKAAPATKAAKAAPATKAAKAVKAATKVKAGATTSVVEAWRDLGSREELRVWADSLSQAGDVRGDFIQLCLVEDPTEEQSDARWKLQKKEGGKLVGPAREFVREWVFDDELGLVSTVTCEADRFIAGFDTIAELHPRLWVSVTSLRKKTMEMVAAMAKLPLEKIYFLKLSSNALSDKALAALAPGLARVRHLDLSNNDLTAAGFTELGKHVQNLELLELSGGQALHQIVDAIVASPGFETLRAVVFNGRNLPDATHVAKLRKLPNVAKVAMSRVELGFDEVEALKRK